MSRLFTVIILLLSLSLHANAVSPWEPMFGHWEAVENSNAKLLIEPVYYDKNQIKVTTYGSYWSKPGVYYYSCSNSSCGGDYGLILDPSGHLFSAWKLEFRRAQNQADTVIDDWIFKEFKNSSPVTYAAYQIDNRVHAKLVISCDLKSAALKMSVLLSEKSYLAAQGATIVAKASLEASSPSTSKPYENTSWKVTPNQYISSLAPVSDALLNDLKNGTTFKLVLIAVKPDKSQVEIENMEYSLSGSEKALNRLQVVCGDNTDLPLPLP